MASLFYCGVCNNRNWSEGRIKQKKEILVKFMVKNMNLVLLPEGRYFGFPLFKRGHRVVCTLQFKLFQNITAFQLISPPLPGKLPSCCHKCLNVNARRFFYLLSYDNRKRKNYEIITFTDSQICITFRCKRCFFIALTIEINNTE